MPYDGEMTHVLLAEDDPAIAEPLARALSREGYDVVVQGTGKGAIESSTGAVSLTDAFGNKVELDKPAERVAVLEWQQTEDMLSLVPDTLREAAASIGLPRALMIMRIAYRAARAGIVTGILLAIARISGETAPLLFTALNNQFFSLNMNQPMPSLPVVIFQFALSPYEEWQKLAWTGALLITVTVLALSILARSLTAGRKSS